MESQKELENKKALKEKELKVLIDKINALKEKSKPKNIMDLVNSFEDACKYKKVKPSSVYNKTDTKDEIAYKKIKFTTSVLNEGHVFTMKTNENRWYAWFFLSSGSGFVFSNSYYGDTIASASSASRLCFKSEALARHAGKILINEYRDFIM